MHLLEHKYIRETTETSISLSSSDKYFSHFVVVWCSKRSIASFAAFDLVCAEFLPYCCLLYDHATSYSRTGTLLGLCGPRGRARFMAITLGRNGLPQRRRLVTRLRLVSVTDSLSLSLLIKQKTRDGNFRKFTKSPKL